MNKKIEPKDKLFFQVDSVKNERWLINKKHIVSAGAPLVANSVTRIVLTSGAIIDTYLPIGSIIGLVDEVSHKNEEEENQ